MPKNQTARHLSRPPYSSTTSLIKLGGFLVENRGEETLFWDACDDFGVDEHGVRNLVAIVERFLSSGEAAMWVEAYELGWHHGYAFGLQCGGSPNAQ